MKQSIVSSSRRGLLSFAAVAAFAVAGLAGVSVAHADPVTLTAKLVPVTGAPPTGIGHVTATYDPASETISWQVDYAGLSGPVLAAHIHGPATPGMDAGVVVPFTPPFPSPFMGKAHLTLDQVSQLLGGLYYVNLHTQAFPGGEIRGQLNVQPSN
ncbi:CHRD domain-containing protein [Acidisoma cellulosilytica]|uniref:CHRD domain-containing protein n=1 Tax=Acidisoma cellulosilyticum TaxID=2802395 RepID=A0A963Z1M7_9PROT|nr:CHRD domain-containing protein [Acidisoma cellulosilyticum]MCB8880178.1 CHRD domain-containing protein [Acidisoma cellulosilyticum]